MKLWGKEYTKYELMRRLGDETQGFGVKRSVLEDGPGRGMRIAEVITGTGFSFCALPDRGLDIAQCFFKGVPVSFISKTGYVSPWLMQYNKNEFLRGFTGGLLTTCGYTHMGASGNDGAEELALHGRATSLPADGYSALGEWCGEDYIMTLRGVMREASVFGENLRLTRTITAKAGESCLKINDIVENCGYEPAPLMLLYHCNFGYPMVDSGTRLVTNGIKSEKPRDAAAALGFDSRAEFGEPVHNYREQCFYYEIMPDLNGYACAALENTRLGLTAYVKYQTENLPYLIQWKQTGEQDYVCGLEPATWYPEGRAKAREAGSLRIIKSGEAVEFSLEIGITQNQI